MEKVSGRSGRPSPSTAERAALGRSWLRRLAARGRKPGRTSRTRHRLITAPGRIGGRSATGMRVLFSVRERQVFKWLKQGKTSGDIAQILEISERTANFHVANMMRKLGVNSRVLLVLEAEKNGIRESE